VITRLRDVVDDQDSDLVSHLRVWLSLVLVVGGWIGAVCGPVRSGVFGRSYDDGRGTWWSITPVAVGLGGPAARAGRLG